MKNHSTAKRLRHVLDESELGATALRLGINELFTQGSRSSNPGLKGATALRFATLCWHRQRRGSSLAIFGNQHGAVGVLSPLETASDFFSLA